MRRPVALLTGPRRAALSGVSTHIDLLLGSELAHSFSLIHFEVGREGRDESRAARALRLVVSPVRLAYRLLAQRVAIVHVNTALTVRAYWRDLVYMLVARLCRARVLYQVHGGPAPQAFCRGRRLSGAFVRATLGLADAIVVMSGSEREAFRRFGVAAPVLTLPNGIDCRPYEALVREPATQGRPLRLLYLGRLVREKGLYELIEALHLARVQGTTAELILAGEGPEAAGLGEAATARRLAQVRFVGPVRGAGKTALLSWADLLVLPSYAEGLPYALLESMAAGVPAIATRVGAIPEVVADGVSGLLLEPGAPPAIAAAIRALAVDRAALARMSEASRAIVRTRYSIHRLAGELGALYARLHAHGRGTMSRPPEAAGGLTRAQSLRWRFNRLRCMRPAELPWRLARSIAAHLEPLAPRRGRVPRADREPSAERWVHIPQGLDAAAYVTAAERIAAGTLDIFGLRCGGNCPPRWNRDPKTGIEAPLVFGQRLDYRDRARVGEIKYLWELNRHLHLVTLAQAYALSGDAQFLCVLKQHLESWISACPYGLGPNWCSALEAAIRLINWSIAWQLIGGADAALFAGSEGERFRRRWLGSIYQHARFVRGHFSRHSSANNHLIGEAAGLYIAGLTWPCWPALRRWCAPARRILEREALLQNSADGVNLEQAVCYQQFVLDFLLLALLAGESAGEPFPADYRQRIAAMLAFLASIMDAGGGVPMIGDADDGAVTRLAPGTGFCPYRSLLASGAVLFEDSALRHKARELDDKTRWLLGPQAQERFEQLRARPAALPRRRAFAGGGYYILGSDFESEREIRVVADLGPLGYGALAAHGHADALSFTLSIGGLPFLIDPGTYVYHGGGAWRAYFRGTAAHNTVRIDAVDQSEQGGDFLWLRKARSGCAAAAISEAIETLDGWHDGYLRLADPVLHRRRLTLAKRTRALTVEDRLEMRGEHEVEIFFHCAAECAVAPAEAGFAIRRGPWTLAVRLPPHPQGAAQVYRGSTHPLCGWVSRHYDQREPAATIVWRARLAGPALLRTELIYRSDQCRSDYPPGS